VLEDWIMSFPTSTEDMSLLPGFESYGGGSVEGATVYTHRSPRASVLATVGLLLVLPAAAAVATGVLAAAGAALGLVGTVFAISGLVANRHRHVVGRGNAIIGLVIGALTVAAGVLTVTGVVPWLDADTNQIARLVEWLDANATWARPEL
jgi:hypothetical protein